MGDNPNFLFCCLFLFFFSQGLLLNFVATPLYLYFAVLLCQGKVANAKLLFTFVAVGNRMFFVTVLGIKKPKQNSNDAPLFCAVSL